MNELIENTIPSKTNCKANCKTNFSRFTESAYYPWILWCLASAFLFYKYLLQVSPSIMVSELMLHFHLSAHGLGELGACYFYAYLVMQIPGGILLDYIELRKLLSIAVMVCSLGAYLFSIADTFYLAALGRILIGLGGAFSAIGTMKLISLWFPANRFAYVSGLMVMLGMLGGVGGQAPLALSVEKYGWQSSLFYAAVCGVILSLLMLFVIREKSTTHSKTDTSATKLSLAMLKQNFKGIISNSQCWIISLYSGLAFAPITAFAGFWGVPFLQLKLHLDKTNAGGIISLIFIGFALGCPLSGLLSDKIGNRNRLMWLGSSVGMILLIMIIWLPLSASIAKILLFVFGFFMSFYFISFAVIKEINPLIAGGTAVGFINSFNAVCGAISQPTIGALLDTFWDGSMHHHIRTFRLIDYQMALTLLPVFLLIALGLLVFVRETHCQSSDKCA